MQINRLFEMIYILFDKKRVSAKELAEQFQVSTRTIYRDVEILSSAKIPIYMTKGKNGGISLLSDFVLDKKMLTEEEKKNIITSLYSINALNDNSMDSTLLKLKDFLGQKSASIFDIEFDDWGNRLKKQFEETKTAILSRKIIDFDYVTSKSVITKRTVEPYVLWFKDKTWYLKAYCKDRNAIRIFRFTRMSNVVVLNENYSPRELDFSFELNSKIENYIEPTEVLLRVDKLMAYRIFDEFPNENIKRTSDGDFDVKINYIEDEWLYGYLMSFGSSAIVVEPKRIREIIKNRFQKGLDNYSKYDA